MGRVIHFEISADKPERAIKFYQDALGWDIKKFDSEQDYWLCMTGDEKNPGIDGAIMMREKPGEGMINTIDVESIEDSRKKILASGGKLISDVNPIPGVGLFCYCEDTEGNKIGIMQSERS